ncbi:MAG: hypothetical protein ACRDL5_14340, partial [Solirubrobacteraceae bacterium]
NRPDIFQLIVDESRREQVTWVTDRRDTPAGQDPTGDGDRATGQPGERREAARVAAASGVSRRRGAAQ